MQIRDAAEALGVHYQTAYGWVRQGVLPARKNGRGYQVLEADVRAFAARRAAGRPPQSQIQVRDWATQADRLHAALVAGDETLARQRLDRLAAGVPLVDLCERVVGPALRRLGDEWSAGVVSIAAEHRASVICERLIALRSHQRPGRPRGVAVVATPPGERHGLPPLMAAACLREDRWLVHHLAHDLPVAEVVQMAAETGASLVVLSSATAEAATAAATAADQITTATSERHVLAGRPGDSLRRLLQQARACIQ